MAADIKTSRPIIEKFKRFLHGITVEPIVFCNFLAIAFFRVAEHAGLYKVICIQNYQSLGEVDCQNLKASPEIEDKVQQEASVVNMYLSLAYLIPAIFSDIFLGAWADKHGRQINILIGLTGLIVASFPFAIVLTWPETSLALLFIANMIAGATGYIGLVMISVLAYLTDIVHDKSTLTLRMAHVYVFHAAAAAVGSFAVGSLVQAATLPYVIMVTEIILFIGFMYTLLRIKHMPPLLMRKLIAERASTESSPMKAALAPVSSEADLMARTGPGPISPKLTCCQEVEKTFKYIGTLYKEVGHTFFRPRQGHRRCYLHLMTLVYFLFLVADLGLLHGPIMGLFVFHRPFHWSPANLGFWKGAQATLLVMGNLFGSVAMKHFFKFQDTSVLMVSTLSASVQLTTMAFSKTSWLLYLSIVFGLFANLTLPTIKSFVAQLVDVDEVGKAFTANGVTTDLAYISSALLFNNIYKSTVSTFPGAVFLFAGGLMFSCFLIVIWIHFDQRKTEYCTPSLQYTVDTQARSEGNVSRF